MSSVHLNVDNIPPIDSVDDRDVEAGVLMVRPTHYDVVYEINPHMKGNIGSVDVQKAMAQWCLLKETYESLGFPVCVLEGEKDLPDMVFTANQTFPFVDVAGNPQVILSKMASAYRQDEVEYFAEWYAQNGYSVIRHVDPPIEFEGMGDAIWHPGKMILYIGYGFRTQKGALQRAADCIGCDVVGLELVDPHFYHLDTALSVIDQDTALYVPSAFTETGIEILQQQFSNLIVVPLLEAKEGFVTNGHSPDGKHFIVHNGNTETVNHLQNLGITVIEVNTSEFMKSGGSVFCMKMMLPKIK